MSASAGVPRAPASAARLWRHELPSAKKTCAPIPSCLSQKCGLLRRTNFETAMRRDSANWKRKWRNHPFAGRVRQCLCDRRGSEDAPLQMFPLTLLTTLIAPVMFHGGVFVTERKRQVMRGTNCSAEKQIPPTAARERRDTRTVLARTAWDSRKTQKASIHSPG